MKLPLSADAPEPLYHQIAEAIRYRVSTGQLRGGERLPALREASVLWGVNLHTVRRAYAELERAGYVRTERPDGTTVLDRAGRGGSRTPPEGIFQFLERVSLEAKRRFGVSQAQLAELLHGAHDEARLVARGAWVVECTESQAADLSRQIESRWSVSAAPWVLSRRGEPPAGVILGTYFHYNEIRRRWPKRATDVVFAAIHPDPALLTRLSRVRCGRRRSVLVVERDATMAHNIAADLAMLPAARSLRMETVTTQDLGALFSRRGATPMLFSPRAWGELSDAQRSDPRALEIRYVFDNGDLEDISRRFHWPRRRAVV